MTAENWRQIPGLEGTYEVSDLGRIRSFRNSRGGMRPEPMVLQPTPNKLGYRTVSLRGARVRVGRLVLLAFVGEPPEGTTCDHVNRDRLDDRLTNLRWATVAEQTENRSDTARRGEEHGNSTLTEEQVVSMRERRAAGESCSALSSAFGVNVARISAIVTGRAWKHAGGPITEPQPKTLPEATAARIIELARGGMCQGHIADEVGVAWKAVRRVLRDAGITATPGRAPKSEAA